MARKGRGSGPKWRRTPRQDQPDSPDDRLFSRWRSIAMAGAPSSIIATGEISPGKPVRLHRVTVMLRRVTVTNGWNDCIGNSRPDRPLGSDGG